MNRIAFAIAGMFLTAAAMAQHTVQLQIKALPEFHPSGSSIYVAGSFNGWNPHDEGYKFKKDDKGSYYLDLKLDKGPYEYKLTRGGWDKVECKKQGAGIENRLLKVEENTSVKLEIEEWADRFPAVPIQDRDLVGQPHCQ